MKYVVVSMKTITEGMFGLQTKCINGICGIFEKEENAKKYIDNNVVSASIGNTSSLYILQVHEDKDVGEQE